MKGESRKERKARADKERLEFIIQMTDAVERELDLGASVKDAILAGGKKEHELKERFPEKKQLITQAAAQFVSIFRIRMKERENHNVPADQTSHL